MPCRQLCGPLVGPATLTARNVLARSAAASRQQPVALGPLVVDLVAPSCAVGQGHLPPVVGDHRLASATRWKGETGPVSNRSIPTFTPVSARIS